MSSGANAARLLRLILALKDWLADIDDALCKTGGERPPFNVRPTRIAVIWGRFTLRQVCSP
jgi:hypothetical protein